MAPPGVLRSLTGERTRLGQNFVDTELEGFKVRGPVDGVLHMRLSQVLFLVSDLERVLS